MTQIITAAFNYIVPPKFTKDGKADSYIVVSASVAIEDATQTVLYWNIVDMCKSLLYNLKQDKYNEMDRNICTTARIVAVKTKSIVALQKKQNEKEVANEV